MKLLYLLFLFLTASCKKKNKIFDDLTEKEAKAELRKIDAVENATYPGHDLPLGSNIEPLKVLELKYLPNPVEFFDSFVKPSRPVVFRGAAKKFPHFEKFSNDSFLNEKYGDWVVDVETSKKENIMKLSKTMKLNKFINLYRNKNIYVLTDVMQEQNISELTVLPKPILCADFLKGINSFYMHMSSGETKTYLRRDTFDHIICQYDGITKITLGNKRYQHYVKLTEEGYVDIDVDKVDMRKHADLSRLPWYQTTISPGDCIYVPHLWYNQITTSKHRNLYIGTYVCPVIEMFSRRGCIRKMKKVPHHAPWSKFKPASDVISNKCVTKKLWKRLIALFNGIQQPIDGQTFYEILYSEMPIGTQLEASMVAQTFDAVDTNRDGFVSLLDIYKSEDDILQPLYYIFHGSIHDTLEVATGIKNYSQQLLEQMQEIKKKALEMKSEDNQQSCQAKNSKKKKDEL